MLPQLWVASVAQIQSPAQERPYAAGAALKLKKKKMVFKGMLEMVIPFKVVFKYL